MTYLLRRFVWATKTVLAAVVWGLGAMPAHAALTDLNDIPMAVSNQVQANFLVVLDNSQSMDAFMGGALQSGDNPGTRGNIGRKVLREMLDDYRSSFRWGLMSFDAPNPLRRNTHVYYMGNDLGMAFTDDCVAGVSASHGGRRCVGNPQSFPGGNYVTYDMSSDDPAILDVLYSASDARVIWGLSLAGSVSGSTNYDLWFTHLAGKGNQWAESEFTDLWGKLGFTPTDSGFLASYPAVTRQFYLFRGWGFRAPITGGGKLLEEVAADSAGHYASLNGYLASETADSNSAEIKNAALYTPLAGTLASAKDYFSGLADWRSGARALHGSPISAWCQKNFVMLLTDGLPTGNAEGRLYSEPERTDSCSQWSANGERCTGSWTFGKAASDSFDAISALRTVPYTGCSDCTGDFDILTYVIAMGETVANAGAVAVMNKMAEQGGTSAAFFATDPTSLKNAIADSVNNAVAMSAAAAAVAVANANITETTAAYQSSYESGNWTGDLKSYTLDVVTGVPKTNAPLWSAQEKLDVSIAGSRRIASYDGSGHGVQFRASTAGTATTLSAEQEAVISKSDGAGIINYLRGERSGEAATSETAQKYRRRTHLLGDIVNSEPVLLGAPSASYTEAADPGYDAFKTAKAGRQAVVFQGANDGMVHAFNADSGVEEWAYVPSLLFANLAKLALVHGFSHRYYVDGTPSVGDVDFSRTSGSTATSPDWRSILVGGLGKGGYGYYALDVTSTAAGDEAAVAAKVLWEFPNASTPGQVVANLGYSFGRPVITKTSDQGWVVLVSSGYNNTRTLVVQGVSYTGDGGGHLYVLNPRTGEVISDIPTGAGSTASPSGLAAFSAYLDNADSDNTVAQLYAGDLLGNVWRFELTGAASTWNVKRLATLVDDGGRAQPVTTAPELASIYEDNATYRFIYVGTGQYLGDSDVTTSATQTMYGLVDDLSGAPTIDSLRASLQQQTLSQPFAVQVTDATTGVVSSVVQRTATANKVVLVGGGKKRGWYIDLPVSGERVSTDPQLALGSLVFSSNIPSGVLCVPGGSSYLNILDYRTGGALDASVLAWSSKFLGNALASRPVLVQLPSGELRALIRLSSDKTIAETVPSPLSTPKVRRVSWRELPDK